MNKKELIRFSAIRANVSQPVMKRCLDGLLSTIVDHVSIGEKIVISDFGTFFRKRKAPTLGRDINRGESVEIPERQVPAFSPGKDFKRIVEDMSKDRNRLDPTRNDFGDHKW